MPFSTAEIRARGRGGRDTQSKDRGLDVRAEDRAQRVDDLAAGRTRFHRRDRRRHEVLVGLRDLHDLVERAPGRPSRRGRLSSSQPVELRCAAASSTWCRSTAGPRCRRDIRHADDLAFTGLLAAVQVVRRVGELDLEKVVLDAGMTPPRPSISRSSRSSPLRYRRSGVHRIRSAERVDRAETPVSSAMICCVRRAIFIAASLGIESASS